MPLNLKLKRVWIERGNMMLSIIIPIFNQHEMSAECIQTVMENTEDYEIIVVDNGSNPPFEPPFSGFNEIRIIRNEENKGFPVAINQGIREAKGEIIILLNNDVFVPTNALNQLAKRLDTFDIVGPTTNYCAGLQRVQLPSYQNIDELNQEAEMLLESSEGEYEEVNWIIGFCMAFKKSVWETVGEFDESLWPCSGEEIDFCYKAKEKGFKVGIARDTYVHHEGSVTFKDMEDAGQVEYAKVCERNDKHLAERWGVDFWNRQAIDENAEIVPCPGLNLNLGCGFDHKKGYINIDNRVEVSPDLVCDIIPSEYTNHNYDIVRRGGLPYGDNSVDMVRAYDFLEHIPTGKTIGVIDEIWRVLKPGGKFESLTPDAEYGQGAFQDPTHISFWVENSWLYFSEPNARALYNIKANFEIKTLERIQTGDRVYHLHVIAEAIKDKI